MNIARSPFSVELNARLRGARERHSPRFSFVFPTRRSQNIFAATGASASLSLTRTTRYIVALVFSALNSVLFSGCPMRIAEIFQSKQGEGMWTGVTSTFVRTIGCNLRCGFCDTTYASWQSEEGEVLSVEEVVARVLGYNGRHVVITGGEPMLHSELIPLTRTLADHGLKITIETAGTLELPVVCDLMSISPKLSNSYPWGATESNIRLHEVNRKRPNIVRTLLKSYPYQLKFVVDEPEDLLEVEDYLRELGEVRPDRVYLMPMAIDVAEMRAKAEWIVPYAGQRGYRYCPRMQLEWYGNRRGT